MHQSNEMCCVVQVGMLFLLCFLFILYFVHCRFHLTSNTSCVRPSFAWDNDNATSFAISFCRSAYLLRKTTLLSPAICHLADALAFGSRGASVSFSSWLAAMRVPVVSDKRTRNWKAQALSRLDILILSPREPTNESHHYPKHFGSLGPVLGVHINWAIIPARALAVFCRAWGEGEGVHNPITGSFDQISGRFVRESNGLRWGLSNCNYNHHATIICSIDMVGIGQRFSK